MEGKLKKCNDITHELIYNEVKSKRDTIREALEDLKKEIEKYKLQKQIA